MTRQTPARAAVAAYCESSGWQDHNGEAVAQCSMCARTVRQSQLSLVTVESARVPLGGPSAVVCRSCARRIVA